MSRPQTVEAVIVRLDGEFMVEVGGTVLADDIPNLTQAVRSVERWAKARGYVMPATLDITLAEKRP